MSYAPSLSRLAEQQLLALPEPLRSFAVRSLQDLSRSPSSFTRPSLRAPRGLLAEFHFTPDDTTSVWLRVTFFYGTDEQTILIENIDFEFGG